MATYTENYDFTLPEEEDAFDVADYNSNFETIDALIMENDTTLASIDKKIGTPEDTEAGTLFGALSNANAGNSVIKSIQYFISSGSSRVENTFTLTTVDTSKTIVLLERLRGSADAYGNVTYSLSASALTTTVNASSGSFAIGFWVIEFN